MCAYSQTTKSRWGITTPPAKCGVIASEKFLFPVTLSPTGNHSRPRKGQRVLVLTVGSDVDDAFVAKWTGKSGSDGVYRGAEFECRSGYCYRVVRWARLPR